jgi:hypothetical protein
MLESNGYGVRVTVVMLESSDYDVNEQRYVCMCVCVCVCVCVCANIYCLWCYNRDLVVLCGSTRDPQLCTGRVQNRHTTDLSDNESAGSRWQREIGRQAHNRSKQAVRDNGAGRA